MYLQTGMTSVSEASSSSILATAWQNQESGCAPSKRLRSAWASAQSDQSLRCLHEESLGPLLPIERTAKTLIRLGGCPGWSESSLGAQPFCWFCHVVAYLVGEQTTKSMVRNSFLWAMFNISKLSLTVFKLWCPYQAEWLSILRQ